MKTTEMLETNQRMGYDGGMPKTIDDHRTNVEGVCSCVVSFSKP